MSGSDRDTPGSYPFVMADPDHASLASAFADWLQAAERALAAAPALVALVGFPVDHNSSFARGAAAGPAAIRRELDCDSANSWNELGVDVSTSLVDLGDAPIGSDPDWHRRLERVVAVVAAAGRLPLSLGGDHSITYPVVRALAGHHGPLTILHFDAHPDIYPAYRGNPLSHASPFARICEDGLARRLIQIGIRTLEPEQRRQIKHHSVEVIEMRELERAQALDVAAPVYVSVDLDVLDPAFAPGVSHREPGGMSTRQLLDALQRIDVTVVGADVVELNPRRDLAGLAAGAAAKIVKEIAGILVRRGQQPPA